MAAKCVLGMVRSSRRLTTRDVAATFVSSWGRFACRCATIGAGSWLWLGGVHHHVPAHGGFVRIFSWVARAVRT